jgi:hypothetical protein
MARALICYFATYGAFEHLAPDPGSDLTSETLKTLNNNLLGIRHNVSLVDRPQSRGVEHTNKLILRHLRALVYDEKLVHSWSQHS